MDSPPFVTSIPWDLASLRQTPSTRVAEDFTHPGNLRAVYFPGPPWRGADTEVFAWIGLPTEDHTGPVPGVVLVHGGGGTAFPEDVLLWNQRGFAAIAMDTGGCVTGGTHDKRPRHARGGPPGSGSFQQLEEPVEDHWHFHGVAAVLRARALLASLPGVDPGRIHLACTSWGGVLGFFAAALEPAFTSATFVYSAAFPGRRDHAWPEPLLSLPPDLRQRWFDLWDPSPFLAHIQQDTLWLCSATDFAFPLPMVHLSAAATAGRSRIACRPDLPHNHRASQSLPEPFAFPQRVLPLAGRGWWDGLWLHQQFTGDVLGAELCFTEDGGDWKQRRWQTRNAEWVNATARAPLPPHTHAAFLRVRDPRGCWISGSLYRG